MNRIFMMILLLISVSNLSCSKFGIFKHGKRTVASTTDSEGCLIPNIGSSAAVKEKLISLVSTFSVESEHGELGMIKKKVISAASQYYWKDSGGETIATARRKLLSFGTEITVYNCKGSKIGSIEEEVLKSLIKVKTVYKIKDHRGHEVATSKKLDLGATSMTVSRDGEKLAKLKLPFVRIKDNWEIQVYDNNVIDSRILIMLGVFKTDADK